MPIAVHTEAVKSPQHEEIIHTIRFRRSAAETLALVAGRGVTLTWVAAGRYDVTFSDGYNGDMLGAHASWNPTVADDGAADATTLRATATIEDYGANNLVHVRVKDGASALAEIPTTVGAYVTLTVHFLASRA